MFNEETRLVLKDYYEYLKSLTDSTLEKMYKSIETRGYLNAVENCYTENKIEDKILACEYIALYDAKKNLLRSIVYDRKIFV